MFEFHYCEKGIDFVIAYPFNILSNLIFIIIGLFLLYQNNFLLETRCRAINTAAALVICIGVGSSIWHIFLERWLLIFDIGSIAIFVAWYLHWFFTKVMGIKGIKVIGLIALFILTSFISGFILKEIIPMNSGGFLPLLFALTGISFSKKIPKKCRAGFIISAVALLLAIVFRVIDLKYCQISFVGTHFLWHIFCGLSLYGPLLLIKSPLHGRGQI